MRHRLFIVSWCATAVLMALAGCQRNAPPDSGATVAPPTNPSGFQLADGVSVASLEGIAEGYSLEKGEKYTTFVANVSADRLQAVVLALAEVVGEPGYLVIETPTRAEDETPNAKGEVDRSHCDVHYLDNISWSRFRDLVARYARFFVHCGMTNFGFGSHARVDEVIVKRYKVVVIYAEDPDPYVAVLERFGLPRRAKLKTVWDNLSQENPGFTRRVDVDGKLIYDVLAELKAEGLRFAERREGP